ncbi:MAG: cytochrome c biogenesis protein ResB, partial [Bacteroidales bacterium]|nr:cytochrome c biogenesis protein ResB [Bacteroidales bacterium]
MAKKIVSLILHKNTTLIAIAVLLILLIIEGFTGIAVHKSIIFFLSISILMLILAFAILKRMSGYSLKNTAFLLTHAGLFMVLLFGCFGSLKFQKLYVRTFHEVPENIAFDDEYSMYQLPFQITLKNFEAEFYDNHQPKSYKAEIMLKDGDTEKQVVLAVNHPTRFMGYDVYLSSYDRRNPNNPDFVMFLVVYDPYVYAKYFGIIVLLAGLFLYIFTLSFSKNRLVSLFIALFGLGFSYMVFSPYVFGGKKLIPALQSWWFVPHIAVYMFAYGALAVACLLGIYTICKRRGVVHNAPTNNSMDFSLNLGISL